MSNYLKNQPYYQQPDDKTVDEIKTYDFNSTYEYYEKRKEFDFVGIIDKEPNRKGISDFVKDAFKVRDRRPKILEKKRQTGIPSYYGAVCHTAKDMKTLLAMAHKVKLNKKELETTPRIDICAKIRDQLLIMEKYGTSAQGNKMTYMIVPFNHPNIIFPLNLEDRMKYIINEIQNITKLKLDVSIKKTVKNINMEGFNGASYVLSIKDNPQLKLVEHIINKYKGKKEGNNWTFLID